MTESPKNVAAAVNVGRPGQTTAVSSEEEVTVVKRGGRTAVTRVRRIRRQKGRSVG